MTPLDELARIDSVIDSTHVVAADSLEMSRGFIKSLVADSRALWELVAVLPKCHCGKVATMHGYTSGARCDEHPGFGHELPTAAVTRKLGV